MTLEHIEAMDKEILTCKDVAPLLGCNPYSLHGAAQSAPEKLGFPVIVMGTRVKIPRRPFIAFMKGAATGG